jgi:hypothetical protein
MSSLTSRKLRHAALAGILTLAGTGAILMGTGVNPAMALCKYGGPNCVNPHVGDRIPTGGNGIRIPDSGWVDPDCKYYGNCQSPGSARGTPANPRNPLGRGPFEPRARR